FRSEAILVIAYHLEHRTFQCIAPPQIVSGDACDYTPPLASDLPDGYRCVGTVHSHGELPAFHSCTDEDDERVSDGIHITVGRLDQQVVEIVASLAVSGCRFPQAVERVLGGVRPVHRRVRVARRSVRRHELLRLVERFERTGHRADLAELLSHLPMGSADRCIGYEVERVHTTAGGAGAGTHPEWMRMVAQPPVRRRRASHTPSAKVLTAPARLGTPKGAAGAPRRVLRRWQ
ncbi:hypothetical protein HY480_03100, partial [Candidatus Uhrbacteria bacterium]|nr:hypothetical protein [Candidatus Uhrbacteria bacterium]